MPSCTVSALEVLPLSLALHEPFGIASGSLPRAENLLVRLEVGDGVGRSAVGLGEAAPLPAYSGETAASAAAALTRLTPTVLGADPRRLRVLAASLAEQEPGQPAARAAIELAVLDAQLRLAGVSMFHWFGGATPTLERDVTIPTGDVDTAARSAEKWVARGFTTLKLKVGGVPLSVDRARLAIISERAPHARLILDGNAALDWDTALGLLDGPWRSRLALFEQPFAAADHDTARRLREQTGVLVAADESARAPADAYTLAKERAADVVNVKLMKCGVVGAYDLALAARACGLSLMMGGLVETRLAMTAAACLAGGVGEFRFIDLDTPLFLAEDPFEGGFADDGPALDVGGITAGHGVTVRTTGSAP